MKTTYTALLKLAKDSTPTFILIRDLGECVTPGFKIYQGKIQGPAKKFKGNWYPCAYYTSREARLIYRAIVDAAPDGTHLLPEDDAISFLLHTDQILKALES
jgi:hypothetical protein